MNIQQQATIAFGARYRLIYEHQDGSPVVDFNQDCLKMSKAERELKNQAIEENKYTQIYNAPNSPSFGYENGSQYISIFLQNDLPGLSNEGGQDAHNYCVEFLKVWDKPEQLAELKERFAEGTISKTIVIA